MRWKVWNPEHADEADARVITANTVHKACEDWAEHDDAESAGYTIVGGEDVIVCVQPLDKYGQSKGPVRRFRVSGEPYLAIEIKGDG